MSDQNPIEPSPGHASIVAIVDAITTGDPGALEIAAQVLGRMDQAELLDAVTVLAGLVSAAETEPAADALRARLEEMRVAGRFVGGDE